MALAPGRYELRFDSDEHEETRAIDVRAGPPLRLRVDVGELQR